MEAAVAVEANSEGLVTASVPQRDDVDEVIRRLKENGYLNDQRFAESFANWRRDNDGIGKTKVVTEERAASDYVASTRLLGPLADYFVVNVSSPNTPGLRNLQAVELLRPLLTAVKAELAKVSPKRPLLVKIAPDLNDTDIDAIADLALELGLDGIIASNTTISRSGLLSSAERVAACGVRRSFVGLSTAVRAAGKAGVSRERRGVGKYSQGPVPAASGGLSKADRCRRRPVQAQSIFRLLDAAARAGRTAIVAAAVPTACHGKTERGPQVAAQAGQHRCRACVRRGCVPARQKDFAVPVRHAECTDVCDAITQHPTHADPRGVRCLFVLSHRYCRAIQA